MKIDVLFVISDMQGGGAQRVLSIIMHELVKQGYSIALLTLKNASQDMYNIPSTISRYTLNDQCRSASLMGKCFNNIFRLLSIRHKIQGISPKLVFSFIFTTNILVLLATLGLKQKVIISERNDPSRQTEGWVWDKLRTFLYKHADKVTANSAAAVSSLSQYVPLSKLHYLPNPILLNHRIRSEVSGKKIVAVGRLHPQKALNLLISAFAAIHKIHPDWQLYIVGNGPEEDSLKKLVEEYGIVSSVYWVGFTKEPEHYYQACDIFVLPSIYEGTSNALLEAMAHGLPIIVSDSLVGIREFIHHGDNALYFRSGNEMDLKQQLIKLITNDALRKRLANRAYQTVQLFDIKNILPAWKQLITL